MKVLFLPQTGPLGPSSRYRVYQLLPWLKNRDIDCEVSPAIDDELYSEIYLRGRASYHAAFVATWRKRRADLARLNDFDAVVVQKGVFPGLYTGFERRIASRKPLVFDFDDAVWLPREGGSRLLRVLHRERAVQEILQRATAVVTGNNFLADYARQFNRNVHVLPSVVDVTRYTPSTYTTTIGWIGSKTTLPYLKQLQPVFKRLGVIPRILASGDPSTLDFEADFRPWQLESETDELAQIGIGIAPMPDSDWERGKCGVKVLQYMACSLPVVASPVGVHKEMIRHGETGFLANTTEEWIEYLRQLIADPSLRQRLGIAARKTVEERYSLEKIAPQMAAVLKSITSH